MSAARQWRFVRVTNSCHICPGGSGCRCDDESGDGFVTTPVSMACRLGMFPCRFFGEIATWSCEIRFGERVPCGNGATTNVVVRVSARRFFGMFVLSYHYELGVVNSRNEYDHALGAQKGGFCNACGRLARP